MSARSALFLLKVRGKNRYIFEIVCRYFVPVRKNYRLIYLLFGEPGPSHKYDLDT